MLDGWLHVEEPRDIYLLLTICQDEQASLFRVVEAIRNARCMRLHSRNEPPATQKWREYPQP
jgi:hypothetical protein